MLRERSGRQARNADVGRSLSALGRSKEIGIMGGEVAGGRLDGGKCPTSWSPAASTMMRRDDGQQARAIARPTKVGGGVMKVDGAAMGEHDGLTGWWPTLGYDSATVSLSRPWLGSRRSVTTVAWAD
ncbi:hypothetical protein NL676_026293 [Syzygium grande]|nr:hypothetical protein NL676_026293 [Syzygium grande]